MERLTGITYTDGRKEILYKRVPVVREGVATVSYPELTKEHRKFLILTFFFYAISYNIREARWRYRDPVRS